MKKSNFFQFISILIFLIYTPLYALVAGPVTVVGTIKSFDKKVVVVESEDSKIEIPKEFVGVKNLKVGNKIEILLSEEQSKKVKIEKKKSVKK